MEGLVLQRKNRQRGQLTALLCLSFLGFSRIFVTTVFWKLRFDQFSPCPFGCTDFKDEVQTDEPKRFDQCREPIIPLTPKKK